MLVINLENRGRARSAPENHIGRGEIGKVKMPITQLELILALYEKARAAMVNDQRNAFRWGHTPLPRRPAFPAAQ